MEKSRNPYTVSDIEEAVWPALVLFAYLFLAGGLLSGCASYGATPADLWCASHRCDAVPMAFEERAPEGHGGLASAIRTVNAASGLELKEDPWGTIIRWAPEVYDTNGVRSCGTTTITKAGKEVLSIEIWIASEWMPGCKPDWMVIRHEIMCHALTGGEGHIETGICSPGASSTVEVDEESLRFMCDKVEGCQLGQRP